MAAGGWDATYYDSGNYPDVIEKVLQQAPYKDLLAERDTALKFLGAINTSSHVAIPEGNSVTRASILAGGAQAGTPAGELARSFMQYKGFGMTALLSSWMRPPARRFLAPSSYLHRLSDL